MAKKKATEASRKRKISGDVVAEKKVKQSNNTGKQSEIEIIRMIVNDPQGTRFLRNINSFSLFAASLGSIENFNEILKYALVECCSDGGENMECLLFVEKSFASAEFPAVRAACMRLIGASTWTCLLSSYREQLLSNSSVFQKAWNSWEKKYKAADALQREQMDFESNWLTQLLTASLRIKGMFLVL